MSDTAPTGSGDNTTLANGAERSRQAGQRMPDEALLALIRQYELASLGSEVAAGATISTTVYPTNQAMTTLEIDRYNATNMFFGRPLGNEVENRSQIVLPELRDTLMWVLAQLMRIFMAAKTVCRFEPETPGDADQANLETEAVNHVFMQQNNGFTILHDFFFDALLMRNGYAAVDWREEKQATVERYSGLSEVEMAMLLNDNADETIEVLEQQEREVDLHLPPPQVPLGAPPPQDLSHLVPKVSVFDLKLRRTAKVGRVAVSCMPPEEMRISPKTTAGLDDCVFATHMTQKPRSDLIADGYERGLVESVASGRPNWLNIDALARNQVVDQLSVENPSDRAMEEVEIRRVIMRVDVDGDGIAELRRVLVMGDKIAENEVIEETPFASCTTKRMAHRHTGISLYDEVGDLQIIKTTLFRQSLDNFALQLNRRTFCDWRNTNFDDLLTSRPGGVVRGNGPPSNWVMESAGGQDVMTQVMPALSYLDQLKASRTGIGPGFMAVDPDELQDVTKGAHAANLAQAQLKVEMIARLLAEGVKDLFRKIHSTLIRHQDKPMQLEISGKWVTIDPTQWRRRSKVSVNVGLGSGNRDEMRQHLMLLAQAQAQLGPLGLVGPQQAYETFKMTCEALGFTTPERFAMDPKSPEYQQHMQQMQASQHSMPQPQVQEATIRMQTALGQQQAENARASMKLAADTGSENKQLVHDMLQNRQTLAGQAFQGHKDREVQLDANHLQIILKLIPALAQILSAEKRAPEELGADVSQAGSQIQ